MALPSWSTTSLLTYIKYCNVHDVAAIIFAHNHPSGVAEPSHADQSLTQCLKDALVLLLVLPSIASLQ
ncbi:MAG: hypothetical protein HY272_08485 [Gammaproteobacteria bacterium]|nr:hypothetical protein [Gammaproteobacteria bacterium]